jgi:hypothetical protein
LILVCAVGVDVQASNIKGLAAFDAESHAKDCQCGSKCRGASCCCGSPKTRPKASTKGSAADRGGLFENPCWNQAPCGDPIAPGSAPIGSYFKVAALLTSESLPRRDGGQRLVVPTSCLSTNQPANRLDRPPRIVGLA